MTTATRVAIGLSLPFWFSQTLPAVEPVFEYNIVEVTNTAPGQYPEVTFTVTNPATGERYDILSDAAFKAPAGASRLFVQIGWSTTEYTNKGSLSNVAPASLTGPPPAAALPIGINTLTPATRVVGDRVFKAVSTKPVPADASGSGVAALEGHPAAWDAAQGKWVAVPVRSAYKYFAIRGSVQARREVVDINKCKSCHGTLSLHGSNRTDEIRVCVACHNPNATDIQYRRPGDGPEVATDFKNMIHSIHAIAAGRRRTPLRIIGHNHSLVEFSRETIQPFSGELKRCNTCHVPGTWGLPLKADVMGSTVDTQSVIQAQVDETVSPARYLRYNLVDGDHMNDLKITPVASVCSACHTSSEVRNHMVSKGASFAAPQYQIASGAVRERCNECHAAGKKKDVTQVHSDE